MEVPGRQIPFEGDGPAPGTGRPDDRGAPETKAFGRRGKKGAGSQSDSSGYLSDKDNLQKKMLGVFLWDLGYFVQANVKLLHPEGSDWIRRELTDVDVYGVLMSPELHIDRVVGDCKTLQRVSAINRMFWLKGVMEYLTARKGFMILRNDAEEDHKLTARSMGITVLNDQAFELFRSKLLPQTATADSRVFDWTSWHYLESALSNQSKLEALLQYRKARYWRDSYSCAARFTLMETRGARADLRRDQRHHVALVGDMVTLFALALQGIMTDIFPIYLIPGNKEELDDYLKTYLYGGRDTYNIMNALYRQAVSFGDRRSESGRSTTDGGELTLPEWSKFLQLFRTLLEHPRNLADVPRFMRWIVFEQVLYDNAKVSPQQLIKGVDTLTMKLTLQVSDYFCKGAGIDPAIGEHLSARIGDAILHAPSTGTSSTASA